MDEDIAAADAVAESSAERWRFSGGRGSETGSRAGTHVAPSECWRSGWDHEFESPLLQRRVCKLSVPVCSGSTGPMICTRSVMEGSLQGCDVGEDSGAPVSQDYGSRGNAFNGTIKGVQLAIGDAAESSQAVSGGYGCRSVCPRCRSARLAQ
jgi:hypothetical protein